MSRLIDVRLKGRNCERFSDFMSFIDPIGVAEKLPSGFTLVSEQSCDAYGDAVLSRVKKENLHLWDGLSTDTSCKMNLKVSIKCAKCNVMFDNRHDDAAIWILPIKHNVDWDQFCDQCWSNWMMREFLTQSLSLPVRFLGLARHEFDDLCIHVLQIGLGHFGTFIHQDVPWLEEFLSVASSRDDGEPLRAIGVDPVEECLGPLEKIAQRIGNISLVLAAIGDYAGSIKLNCMPHAARLTVRQELERKSASLWARLPRIVKGNNQDQKFFSTSKFH